MLKNKQSRAKKLVLWMLIVPVMALACQSLGPGANVEIPAEKLPQIVKTVEVFVPAEQSQADNPVVYEITSDDTLLVDLYTRVNPSVVNITIYTEQNSQVEAASQGSGFVYDGQGNIITNAHVVQGASEVEVTFADGTTRSAEIVGEDLNSDLAVVRVDDLPAGVGPLPLGDMEDLSVGQTVIAIGNPFGLSGTLTRGIISALGRTIPALTSFSIPQSIQTDAAINPGNSGGPLLNLNGEVVGVNAQIETNGLSNSNLGVGFAIPVSIVKAVVPDLIQDGEHAWAWLGVQGGDVTALLVEAMDLPVEKGAYIAAAVSGGPSDEAGIRGADNQVTVRGRQVSIGGDVIVGINSQPVSSFDDLLVYISLNTKPGDEVTLQVVRDGQYEEITVRLEERPASLNNFQLEP